MKHRHIVIFDLDDTLYKEIDYLKSAYREISVNIAKATNSKVEEVFNDLLNFYNKNLNAFDGVLSKYPSTLTVKDLLITYRNHVPDIYITDDTKMALDYLKSKQIEMGIITDGRSVQQRNKIKALGIERYFSEIVISEEFGSEKPNLNNFKHFENKFGNGQYHYIGDNLKKDFIAPNSLNWTTIHLKDNGFNIHKAPDTIKKSTQHQAKHTITSLSEIIKLIEF